VGEGSDLPGQVGDPVQGPVVKGEHDAVRRRVHVGLDVAVAHVDSLLERPQGVLDATGGTAAMGEGDRPVVVQERVAIRT
jgi:hypothetical protein